MRFFLQCAFSCTNFRITNFRYHDCWITNPDTTTVGSPVQIPRLLDHQFRYHDCWITNSKYPDCWITISRYHNRWITNPNATTVGSPISDTTIVGIINPDTTTLAKFLTWVLIKRCRFSKSFTVFCQTFVHLCLESSSSDPHRASLQHPQVSGEWGEQTIDNTYLEYTPLRFPKSKMRKPKNGIHTT